MLAKKSCAIITTLNVNSLPLCKQCTVYKQTYGEKKTTPKMELQFLVKWEFTASSLVLSKHWTAYNETHGKVLMTMPRLELQF